MADSLFFYSLFFLSFAALSHQYTQFDLKNVSNTGSLLNLDNGLSGRSTGIVGNNTKDVQHGLFFVTKDGTSYTLSVIAYDPTEGDSYSAEVIWEANQTRLVSYGADLEFINGNMLLKDSGETVWQTNTANRGVKYVQVSDRGNIVLVNTTGNSGNKIWMTFDSPTDTLVCSQVLKYGMHLSSGHYSLVLEQSRLALVYKSTLISQEWAWNDTLKSSVFLTFCCDQSDLILQLRSDVSKVSEFLKFSTNNCTNTSDLVVESILQLKSSNEFSNSAFVTLENDGQISASKWVISKQLSKKCGLLTGCGSYGLCSNSTCRCPSYTYFEASVNSDPDAGCKLKSKTYTDDCESASFTATLQGIDYLPNNHSSYQNVSSVEQCESLCLQNTTCQAGFYRTHTKQCFQVSLVESLISENSSYVAFFKICTDSSSGISTKAAIIIGVCVGVAGLGIITAATICIICWRRSHADDDYSEESDGTLSAFLSESTLKRFTYKDLEEMTNGFSVMLGRGGFGSVYKGVLANGSLVAVKKLEGSGQSSKEFYAEMSILSRVHHTNLVQLIGFCSNRSKRALVYEHMANGSLDKWLNPPNQLSWKTRLDIAIGAAKGLAYLHEECNERIIHLDMKPQNILLDENFYPKVGDFGLSKLTEKDQSFVMTTVRGTRGYLAPDWFTEGAISEKTDVYSFGVVLLDLIIGSRPDEISARALWECSQSQEFFRIMDKCVFGEGVKLEQVKMVMEVAALCVQQDPDSRPAMSRVVEILEGKVETPQMNFEGFRSTALEEPIESLDLHPKELLEAKTKSYKSDVISFVPLGPS